MVRKLKPLPIMPVIDSAACQTDGSHDTHNN